MTSRQARREARRVVEEAVKTGDTSAMRRLWQDHPESRVPVQKAMLAMTRKQLAQSAVVLRQSEQERQQREQERLRPRRMLRIRFLEDQIAALKEQLAALKGEGT